MNNSLIISLPYLILYSFYFFLGIKTYKIKNNSSRKQLEYCCIFVFILFYGLRGFVAWDWLSYYDIYNSIPATTDISNIIEIANYYVFEIGYVILMVLIKHISNDYHFFIFVLVCIDVVLLYLFFKRYSVNIPLSFALFVLTANSMELNLLRNIKGVLLCLLAFKYIQEKKLFKYILAIFFASLFHVSSLLFLPLYFLNRRINKKILVGIFIIGNIIYLLKIGFITNLILTIANLGVGGRLGFLIQFYIQDHASEALSGISLGYLERVITTLYILLHYNKLTNNENNLLIVNSYFIYFFLQFFCTEIPMLVERVGAAMFIYPYWFIWIIIINNITDMKLKKGVIYAIFFYSTLKILALYSAPTYEYENILFGIRSYEERLYMMGDFIE